jgi:hypothetical protein
VEQYSREQFLKCLRNNWGRLLKWYSTQPLADQRAYLEKQGYASLAALLGHVISWWQDGARVIAQIRLDPSTPLPKYDVDAFNAQAVQRYESQDEAEVARAFESQRLVMEALLDDLSDAEIVHPSINRRLYFEILMHWKEHEPQIST